MDKKIRIGTRSSKLALWQAEHVATLIQASGYGTEIFPMETKGDKILDVTLSKIGSKGVFTEELEMALIQGNIDIAVHSAKDLPGDLPEELELLAFTEREIPNDVVLSAQKGFDLGKGNPKVGTSSTRRIAFLKHYFPNVETISIRGNLQTRIAKLQSGDCDALLLAFAGVHRMAYDHWITEKLETSYFVPPVGQGSIAIECHKKLNFEKKELIERWVNHPDTEDCLRAERSFLKTLQGGCSIPSFGYAQWEGNLITLKGGIISLDGKKILKIKRSAPPTEAHTLGKQVAREVLDQGGTELLLEIRKLL